MKVTKETASVLELKHTNWFGVFFGAAIMAAGLAMLFSEAAMPGRKLWIAGLVVLAIGAIVVVAQRFVTLTLDRGRRLATINTQRIVGGSRIRKIEFNRIKEIVIEQTYARTTAGNREPRVRPIYHLVFHLADGKMEEIDITPRSSMAINGVLTTHFVQNNAVMEVGNKVAEFIGVPCVDRRPPTFSQAIEGIQTIIRTAKEQAK